MERTYSLGIAIVIAVLNLHLSLPAASAGVAPEIEPIADVVSTSGGSVNRIPIVMKDDAPDPFGLTVDIESAGTGLLGPGGALVEGDGWTRWLTLFPVAGKVGRVSVTVVVRDIEGLTARQSFMLTIAQGPAEIRMDPMPPQRLWQGGSSVSLPIPVTWTGAGAPTFQVGSSDPLLFPLGRLSVQTGLPLERTLRMQPPADRSGVAMVTVTARRAGRTVSQTVPVIVEPAPLLLASGLPLPAGIGGIGAGPAVAADFDGDGHMDLAVGRALRVEVLLWRGKSYQRLEPMTTASPVTELAVQDLDGDGLPDLLAASGSDVFAWSSGPGDAATMAMAPIPVRWGTIRSFVHDLVPGDFDGDGQPEVVALTTRGAVMLAWQGESLVARQVAGLGLGRRAAAADADGDGDLDLLVGGVAGADSAGLASSLWIWVNDGRGVFTTNAPPLATANVSDVGWADFDTDGRPEPWALIRELQQNFPAFTAFSAYRRDGLHFAPAWRQSTSLRSRRGVAVLDLDADGIPEVVHGRAFRGTGAAAFSEPVFAVHFGDGTGGVRDTSELMLNVPSDTVVPVESGDGRWNFLVDTRVLTNRLPTLNLPPAPPSGLEAQLTGRHLRLSWDEAEDLNQAHGLTYNVRVGTQPGAHDVVSSQSDASGRRRVLASGNAGGRTTFELDLTHIEAERLYWSVQAVDAGLAGGVFARELGIDLGTVGGQPQISLAVVPRFSSIEGVAPRLEMRVRPSQLVLIETSTDLVRWTGVRWLQPPASGVLSMEAPGFQTVAKAGFYRVRLAEPGEVPVEPSIP